MSKSLIHRYQDNEYSFTLFPDGKYEFDISRIKPTDKPKYLYKYYPLNRNSLSALNSLFLYASHPLQLNDKYDCSEMFVDVSGHTLAEYLDSYLINIYSKEQIIELYEKRRDELDSEYLKWEQLRLFRQFGVISMCENYNDILMWAYYAQNNGFLIKFKTDNLPSHFMGPYPINYVDNIEKINSAKKSPILSFLYQSNIKNKLWQNESEWRYVVRDPKGQYHPYYVKKDIKTRFHYYDISSIAEIHLGYDFILPPETILAGSTLDKEKIKFKTNHLEHKLKRSLLTFITKNDIQCYRLLKNTKVFKLGRQEITINRLSSHRYEFYLGAIID